MLKFCVEQWDKNKDRLRQHIENNVEDFNECSYSYLVESVVNYIFNDEFDDDYDKWDSKNITVIDNGDYQGTQLYLIPKASYQPSEDEYLMTYVGYGSCSGCDTLQSVQMWDLNYEEDTEKKEKMKNNIVTDIHNLCLHIVQNTIKPYNYGWRKDDRFSVVEAE